MLRGKPRHSRKTIEVVGTISLTHHLDNPRPVTYERGGPAALAKGDGNRGFSALDPAEAETVGGRDSQAPTQTVTRIRMGYTRPRSCDRKLTPSAATEPTPGTQTWADGSLLHRVGIQS